MSVQTKIRTFDGNVGIGTNNPGSYKLRVVGGATRVVNLSVSSLKVANGDGTVPSGVIAMWTGASVPTGWKLCDGTNLTPDLRDKFIIGSGTYSIGQSGGASSASLTVNNLPSHTHAGTCNTGGSHSHTTSAVSTTGSHGHNINVTTTTGSGGHSHNLTTSTVNHNHADVDTDQTGDHGHYNFNNFNTVNNHQHYGPYLCNQNNVTWYQGAARTNTNSNASVIAKDQNSPYRRAGFTSYANPTHSHTANSNTVNHLHAITTNQVLGHTHTSNSSSTGAHTHTIGASTQSGTHTHAANNSPSAGDHTHNFTTDSTPATTPTISTIPSYYIIAFIMKE